ncbi:Ig-like domain-containing protein [Mycobacterium deserti]|uniref:Ig-like domain-containing protein n=1 Tax=Mycobacterium deserti TaxID=2978347 RepID=A0ABT2MGL1_9MYCO|nr:Ig-like domain-containing protein [Mycobacterium deserti]MCT7660240.1 Ig-like domain-containing protein [Mycobacterium deserti]
MKYSMYIGRVGALAVALGIGAAVASGPGIALADDTESNGSPAGAEAPSSPPADQPENAAEGSGGGTDNENKVTDPPDMQVSGSTVDTGTHDDDTVVIDEADAGGDVDEETEDGIDESEGTDVTDGLVDGDGNATDKSGLGGAQGDGSVGAPAPPSNTANIQPPVMSNAANTGNVAGAQRLAGGGADDNSADIPSFSTTALADPTVETETFSVHALTQAAPAPQNPISALFTLPLRIVSDVLTSIAGGPNMPPGENPLFLGLLAFVRRQFAPFERTFSNQAPIITGALVDENDDGSFTVTVRPSDASDPDGDALTFSAGDGAEGTVEKTGANTFKYTPGEDFDGDDAFTLTASDPGGLFGYNRKSATVTIDIVAPDDGDPTQPENPQPPVQNEDGTAEAELQFDPDKVTNVTVAPGFEPKYWTYQETYNAETGEYEVVLTPTQAGMLRASLGLDTTDSLGLAVTTTETQTIQTFALRSASFAAAAEEPDYTINLPDVPAGHFEVRDPVFTSPDDAAPEKSYPAGVVVTDRYAYALSSHLLAGGTPTLSVIGADPDKADYLQVIDEIPIGGTAMLLTQSGDRLYIASGNSLQVIDIDGTDPIDEADDNALLAPIDFGQPGAAVPIASPDGKTLYVINQQARKIFVVDTDPANITTYHTVIDEIAVADSPTVVDNGDGTRTVSAQFPLSAAFNADGTRMYLVRNGQAYTQNTTTFAISDFRYSGEIVTIDTTTNEVVGTPLPLDGDYGYFASSDGKYLYVPALTMNGFDPTQDTDISQVTGSVNVVDVQDPDNPVIVANLPTGNLPVNVAFSPDKSLAYVVDAGTGTIWVIDTVNQEVLDIDPNTVEVDGLVFDTEPSATLGQVFNVIAASPNGSRLFVTNFSKGTVVPLEFVLDDVV